MVVVAAAGPAAVAGMLDMAVLSMAVVVVVAAGAAVAVVVNMAVAATAVECKSIYCLVPRSIIFLCPVTSEDRTRGGKACGDLCSGHLCYFASPGAVRFAAL